MKEKKDFIDTSEWLIAQIKKQAAPTSQDEIDDGWIGIIKPLQQKKRNRIRKFYITMSAVASLLIMLLAVNYLKNNFNTVDMEASLQEHRFRAMDGRLNGIRIIGNDTLIIPPQQGVTFHKLMQNRQGDLCLEGTDIVISSSDVYNIQVSKSCRVRIALNDNSIIYLNSSSQLYLPQSFANEPKRGVAFCGEGFFEISRNPSHPFTVYLEGLEVNVLGTSFNIQSPLHDTEIKQIALVEGSVEIKKESGELIKVKPNQCVEILKENTILRDIDIWKHTMWKDQFIDLKKPTTCEELLSFLEECYNVQFHYTTSFGKREVYGKLDNGDNLAHLIEILEVFLEVKIYQISESEYKISN